ncbi:MAG: DUF2339 domain-containing protein [Gemmatimonadota bacterium]
MGDADRIDRLEQRVASLEALVRQLVAVQGTSELRGERSVGPGGPRVVPAGARPRPASPRARRLRAPRASLFTEEWIGQRGLLAVGVTALILAVAYLLKLSFERGWVSPLARCLMGAIGGIGVAVIGARLHPRYRQYGAALIGCGAAIIYLSVWAASNRYALVAPWPAIGGLVAVSLALAVVAARLDVEALGAAAAMGAFFAPVTVETAERNPDLLLAYLFCLAIGLGVVAARRRWRLVAFVISASYFGLGILAAEGATPGLALGFGVTGGTAGLFLGLRERWWESRALAFAGGWTIVHQAGQPLEGSLPLVVAALALAAPVWWHGFRAPRFFLDGSIPHLRQFQWSLGEAFYFLMTPLLVAWAVDQQAPRFFDAEPGLLALLIAVPYLIAGYARARPAFAAVGLVALGTAIWTGLAAPVSVVLLILLALALAALDTPLARSDGRWYALGAAAAALLRLADAAAVRSADAPAFVDSWALASWAVAAGVAGLATRSRPVADAAPTAAIRAGLWIVAGGLVLFGVTGELGRLFVQQVEPESTARLAGGLAISAWWLLFAGALVAIGFAQGLAAVRQAGLAVAALALIKVVLADLAGLDALYRVGSVLILGCVSLGIAYLYHRRARASELSG